MNICCVVALSWMFVYSKGQNKLSKKYSAQSWTLLAIPLDYFSSKSS